MAPRTNHPHHVEQSTRNRPQVRGQFIRDRGGKIPAWAVFALLNIATLGVLAMVVVKLWNRPPAPPPFPTPAAQGVGPMGGLTKREPADPAAPGDESRSVAGRVIEKVRNGVVRVSALDARGQEIGFGSGFVIDAAGLVATNRHVIENANKAFVKFRDGTRINVLGIRGLDHDGDLAILELEGAPGNVQVLKLAGDEPPGEADSVIAIGHPKGIEFTTSTGIVSAVRTTADLPERIRTNMTAPQDNVWIQTTAAISGGNSGGPLLNESGEVVGVNTWKADGENLSFAAGVRHLRALRDNLQATALPLAELSTPDTQLARMVQDFSASHQWWQSRMETAATDEEKAELEKSPHPAADFAAKFIALADKHRGKPAAFKALSLACQAAATDTEGETAGKLLSTAAERILAEHADDPGLVNLLSYMSGRPERAESLDMLRKAAATCPSDRTKGLACYLLATALEGRAGDSENTEHDDEMLALLERCVKEFGEVSLGQQSLGQVAEPRLYGLKHLRVGKAAPEIVGKDQHGMEFKLSDYRGKVVVLDFWADWCPHCVRMYPHERSLLKKHADKPFAIVGVNGDEVERLDEIVKRRDITWPNWADGPAGPISDAWRVEGLPTIYVLDQDGIIRARFSGNPGTEALDAAIDKALAALPAAATPASAPAEAPAGTSDAPAEKAGDAAEKTPPADAAASEPAAEE